MTTANASNNATWYVATPEGKQEGPINIAAVKERMQSGSIQPMQLVWREGMTDWTPAGKVPELATAAAVSPATTSPSPASAFPLPSPAVAANPYPPAASTAATKVPASVEPLFSAPISPVVFRMIGRACAVAGLFVIVGSTALYLVGMAQFTLGAVLCLIGIVGEGTAAVLQSQERMITLLSQRNEETK